MKNIIVAFVAMAFVSCAAKKPAPEAPKPDTSATEASDAKIADLESKIAALEKQNSKLQSQLKSKEQYIEELNDWTEKLQKSEDGKAEEPKPEDKAAAKAAEKKVTTTVVTKSSKTYDQAQNDYLAYMTYINQMAAPPVSAPKYMTAFMYGKPMGCNLYFLFDSKDVKKGVKFAVRINGAEVIWGDSVLVPAKDMETGQVEPKSLMPRGAKAYVCVDAVSGWSVEVMAYVQSGNVYVPMGKEFKVVDSDAAAGSTYTLSYHDSVKSY